MPDLRTRIATALDPMVHGGTVDAVLGDVLDAVMTVVDAHLLYVQHNSNGKCRWCGVITSETLAASLRREIRPHRRWCSQYVGPVEHRATGVIKMAIGWANDCSCGDSWRDAEGGCPNSSETWRGPAASISQLSDQSISTTEGSS